MREHSLLESPHEEESLLATWEKGRIMMANSRSKDTDSQPGGIQIQARKEAVPNSLLRLARHRHSWTQQALADQLGTTPLAINRWEQGKTAPSDYFRTRLCDLFGLTAEELGLGHKEPQTSQTPLWLLPYRRNPFFIGREDLLIYLHQLLTPSSSHSQVPAYALCGLGGIGKTQTALEYCYRFGEQYQAVIWLRAETREQLWADLMTLAESLALISMQESEQHRVVEAVQRWLRKQSGWLLILDNVEEMALLEEVLPAQWRGRVLLTTRSQYTGVMAERLELPPLSLEEGLHLLFYRSKLLSHEQPLEIATEEQRQRARAVVELLGGLPLALDQVAAYLEETGCDLTDYLLRYEQYRLALLQRRGKSSREHPHSVAATVELTCLQVQQVTSEALELLSLCAFLHTDAIPEEILTEGQAYLGSVLQQLATDAYRLDEAIATLRAYSLLQREARQKLLTMHRLVQAVLRDRLSSEEQAQWVERLIRALHQIFPRDAFQETAVYWSRCERLLPHALEVLALSAQKQTAIPEITGLLTSVATYLRQRARYSEAEALLQRALQIQEQAQGLEHSDVAWSWYGLAEVYRMQARYTEAEVLYQRVLQIQEQTLEAEHPDIAWSLEGLAGVYTKQGKYAEAEPLLQRALHIWEQAARPAHARMADVLAALGYIYSDQARYSEGEALHQRALQVQEQVLGSDHLLVAITLNNLGCLYNEQGRYAEAQPVLQRSLYIMEQLQGTDHPDLALIVNNLAFSYIEQGRYREAEPLLQHATYIQEQSLEPDHPEVATPLHNLGFIYVEQGRYDEAEPLLQRALSIREQRLGPDHPQFASSLGGLGRLRYSQGHYAEAEDLYQRALQIREKALGSDHPRAARTLIGLAELYNRLGHSSEAERLLQHTLHIAEQGLIQQHPDIAKALATLGALYTTQGRYSDAEPLLQRAVDIAQQVLSNDSPLLAWFLQRFGMLYEAQERYSEAIDLYQQALAIWEQPLWYEPPERATTLTRLAELYSQQGRPSEAEFLLQRLPHVKQLAGAPPEITEPLPAENDSAEP